MLPSQKSFVDPLNFREASFSNVFSNLNMLKFVNDLNAGTLNRPFIRVISNDLQKGKGA